MRNKLVWHQVALLGGLALLSLWKIIMGRLPFGLEMMWWWLGAIIGFLIVFLDRFVYVAIMKEEPLSKKYKDELGEGRWAESLKLLVNERHEQKELMMRSALFVLVWIVLAFFTATSTASFLARGFVLGIGIHICFDLISDFVGNKQRFDLWFWQIKREVPRNEKKAFLGIFAILFLVLAFTL